MALLLTPQIIAIAAGQSATITASDYVATPGSAITATSNNTAVATVSGSGVTPGPVTFTVTATANAVSGCTITFAITGNAAESGAGIPVCIIPTNAAVATGLTATNAIAKVRRRTNLNFGQPSDADITAMLNDGVRLVAKRLEPIIVLTGLPIVTANTNVLALPYAVERVRDANFSTGNPALAGSIVYPMVQLDYDIFVQYTDQTPAGGIGGIPTMYTLIQDASGVQLVQFYPFANVGGQINLHYYKRPTLWTSTGSSTTDLDELWEEAVITYGCQQASESREDTQAMAPYFRKLHQEEMEDAKLESKRRIRKQGTNIVNDVSEGSSIWATWAR